VSEICEKYGLEMASWEDGLYSNSAPMNKTLLSKYAVYANVWNNIWEWGSGGRAYELANAGYKVCCSDDFLARL
jgi:hexosaminidase